MTNQAATPRNSWGFIHFCRLNSADLCWNCMGLPSLDQDRLWSPRLPEPVPGCPGSWAAPFSPSFRQTGETRWVFCFHRDSFFKSFSYEYRVHTRSMTHALPDIFSVLQAGWHSYLQYGWVVEQHFSFSAFRVRAPFMAARDAFEALRHQNSLGFTPFRATHRAARPNDLYSGVIGVGLFKICS